MTEQTTIERVRACVFEVGGFDERVGKWPGPHDDQSLFYEASTETGQAAAARGCAGLDSLDRVELLMMLEDEFEAQHVGLGDAEPDEAGETIEALAAYVDRKLQADA